MSIAPSLPSAEELRELTGRDFSADIFELPPPAAQNSAPESPWKKRSVMIACALALVAMIAGGMIVALEFMPDNESTVVTVSTETGAPASTLAGPVWEAAQPRFDSLSVAPAVESPAPLVVAETGIHQPPPAPVPERALTRAEPGAAPPPADQAAVLSPPAPQTSNSAPTAMPSRTITETPETADTPPSSAAAVVELEIGELESRTLDDVRKMLFRGDRRAARSTLVDFMQQYGERPEPRALLAGLLLQEGRLAQAGALLGDVDPGTPSAALRLLKARVVAAGGNSAAAVRLLEVVPPAVAEMSDYHAMMALLYQQTGQYEASVQVYDALVDFDPDNTRWQLGRAISLEGGGNPEEARVAYQRLLTRGDLPRELAVFADERLRQLSYR